MTRDTIGLAIVAALTACSGSGAKLTVSSQAEPSAASDTTPTTPCPAGDVTLEEVWLVVRHVEIEGGDLCAPETPPTPAPTGLRTASSEDGDTCREGEDRSGEGKCDRDHDGDRDGTCRDGDDDGLEDDCEDLDDECELKYGPFPVVLSAEDLASGVVSYEFDITVPPGTYDELEILVNTIPAKKAGGDPVLEEMAAEHASVLVRGNVAGEDFTWTTNVAFKQETEPLTIPPEGANVTLELDTTGWFVDPNGCEPLDPRDPGTRTRIARNIRASFKLMNDDDRDGCDDDDEGDDDQDDDEDDDQDDDGTHP